MASLQAAAARPQQRSLTGASQPSLIGRRQQRGLRGPTQPAAASNKESGGSSDQPRPRKPRKEAEHATPAIMLGTFLVTEVGLLASGIKVCWAASCRAQGGPARAASFLLVCRAHLFR